MTPQSAFKIFTTDQWSTFAASGRFGGSPADQRDGFIHLSSAEQVDGTIARHFAGLAVTIAEIDLAAYGDTVRWEKSRDGQLFPHIYAPALDLETVCGRPLHRPAPV